MMLVDFISGLFILLTVTGFMTTSYLWKVYLEGDGNGGKSTFLLMLAVGATVCEGVAVALVPLAINRLAGNPPLPYGTVLFILALFIGLGVPHAYAIRIWLLRRQRGSA